MVSDACAKPGGSKDSVSLTWLCKEALISL